jgi:RNA polymerase sigma-54 factor
MADSRIGSGDDRDFWLAEIGSSRRNSDDFESSPATMVAAETTLAEHLHAQIGVLKLGPRDVALARVIVDSLDDDGYLRTPLDELLAVARLAPAVSVEELQIALRRVQALDPTGIAAQSVAQCLALQLPAIACEETRLLAQDILDNHFELLVQGDMQKLARNLHVLPQRVEEVCGRIRRLDPRPGWRFGATRVDYLVPDVLVKKIRGQWTVKLNHSVIPRVRLNRYYAELFQRHRTSENTELAEHLQEARWTIRNAEQRFSTILEVAEAIVGRQRHFLEFGAMAMKPLGLSEIAKAVGIHESTVSRVTNNKFMSTPLGVFELKYFFSRAMVSANGSACSATAIRGLIKDIIDTEPPESPFSDVELARQLGQQGLPVGRRTVTKYRNMLRIAACEKRRRCQ